MTWLLATLFGAICFLLGRVFSQSELILAEKRRAYEAFLVACPSPNDAYLPEENVELLDKIARMETAKSSLLLYAAPRVFQAVSRYLDIFSKVSAELTEHDAPLHPSFLQLARAHNDMAIEMRRDGLAWSAFGYHGRGRLE